MTASWLLLVAAMAAGQTDSAAAKSPNAASASAHAASVEKSSSAAEQLTKPPARHGAVLRKAIHEALKREATSTGSDKMAAIRELIALHGELAADSSMTDRDRNALHQQLRERLTRRSDALKKQLAQQPAIVTDSTQPDQKESSPRLPENERAVLAQRAPRNNGAANPAAAGKQGAAKQAAAKGAGVNGRRRAAAGPNAASPDQAQELIDLIQTTIAPESWDVNGGKGSIGYFSLGHLLVIRQTSEVHEQLFDALEGLRGK